MHEVSKGMIQPNMPSKVNRTVNYEIYTGNEKDKFECPQNTNLVNRKEFVYSVKYPPGALDLSNICGESPKDKKPTNIENVPSNQIMGACEPASQSPVKEQVYPHTLYHYPEPRFVEGACPCCGHMDLGYYTTIVPETDYERNELLHIIETIPNIDLSQLPGEDFLH